MSRVLGFRLFDPGPERTPPDAQKLTDFYRRVDPDFYPKLSDRPGGIEGCVSRFLGNGGTFVLFEADGSVEGAIGGFPHDPSRERVEMGLFALSPQYRRSPSVIRGMMNYMSGLRLEEHGYGGTRRLRVRTWRPEVRRLATAVGFEPTEPFCEPAPDRKTYFFEGDLPTIRERAQIIFRRRPRAG